MSYRVYGRLASGGGEQVLCWEGPGPLTGDALALGRAREMVQRDEDVGVTPAGPFLRARLDEELPAFMVALTLLDHGRVGATTVGDPPELPELINSNIVAGRLNPWLASARAGRRSDA